MGIFRQKGRENNAKIFLKDLVPSKNVSYFLGIGNAVTSQAYPLSRTPDTVQSDYNTWDNLFLINQVTQQDASLMLRQITWQPNTRYEAFNKDLNQYDLGEKFYVFNSNNNNVYICLAAPSNKTLLSTSPPTGETTQIETKLDGYSWKFLYKVSEFDLEKFNYPNFLPIKEISTDLYTDERVLQQMVSFETVRGAIEAITLITQGNAYAAIANSNFLSPIYVAASKTVNANNTVNLEIDPTGKNELILTSDFYNEKYVINFENGFTAVVDDCFVNASGNLEFVLCETFPNNDELDISYQFRILPRIKIIGNGFDAYAVPIVNEDKFITGVTVLSGGRNYSYVNVEVPANNGTTLQPIIGLNGLGNDIIDLLGVKHVMISKTIRPLISLSETDPLIYSSPENTGVVYLGDQYTNIISPETYYTQLSLIKSPKVINNNLEEIAGTTVEEVREMVLEAINPEITIIIGTATKPYKNPLSFFNVGDTIVRGPTGFIDQFRAEIIEVSVGAFSTTLKCSLINGAFETYSGYRIKNLKKTTETDDDEFLNFQDCQLNCSENIAHFYTNIFREDDFSVDDVVYGSTSLTNAKIIKLDLPNVYVNPLFPNRVKIKVKNIAGVGFIESSYIDGVYTPGEIITAIKIVDGQSIIKNRGTLVSLSEPIDYVGTDTLGYAYILECQIDRDGSNDTPAALINEDGISLDTNIIIRQGLNGSVGKIIRTGIPDSTGQSDIVYLYVNNYNGAFEVNTQPIYIIDDLYNPSLDNYKDSKMTVKSIIYAPSIVRYSGKILYINDAGPIQRRLENSENLKLLVEF
jgi:hypothetical protein